MAEYLSKEYVLSCVDDFLSKTGMPIAAQFFYDCFEECKAADVKPLSVVSEHIKNRLYETALNTSETIASDAIADMAERVDWWINELKDCDPELDERKNIHKY